MSEHGSGSGSATAVDLDAYLERFIGDFALAGYAVKTLRDKRRLIVPFIRWANDHAIAACDLDETRIDAFLSSPRRRRYKHRTALQQFVDHLRVTEVAPPCPQEQSPGKALVQKYLDHLRDTRGLSPCSLAAYSPVVRSFVGAQELPENGEALDALAVRAHVIDRCRDSSASSVKLRAAALRSFLRFCSLDGTTARDLSVAVPPVGRWQAAAAAPYLTGEQVEKVVAAADRSTTRGCRVPEDPEVRRLWKKFQQVLSLPEKDRRAVIRLVNSLVAGRSSRNGTA